MSIPVSTRQAYSELDTFIELLDECSKNKIPQKLRKFFKMEKDRTYIKNINPNIPIKEQNLKEETLALIAMLNLQYWCEDENEKEKLKNIYNENEIRHQEELKEKYNPDNLFKNKIKTNVEGIEQEQTDMVQYRKENIFSKIKRLLLKLLNKNN